LTFAAYIILSLSPILVVTVFALVTSSGSLIAYNMNVKALLKITAHLNDDSGLASHQPNVATVVPVTDASRFGISRAIWYEEG
jgi:hypothetical protein